MRSIKMSDNIACIILAAGKGTRMKSALPKVMHTICSRPMLGYVSEVVKELKITKSVYVLGYKAEEVRRLLPAGAKAVMQAKPMGTADAVKKALPALGNFKGTVLVLYADIPLLQAKTLKKLIKYHTDSNLDATLLAGRLDKPEGYGRIMRDRYAGVCGIVEEKDADEYQKGIQEINTGIACFNRQRLAEALRFIKADNRKREYYLTDAIAVLYGKDRVIEAIQIDDINEALGINSRSDLAKAESIMRQRINRDLMDKGVSIVDPGSAHISYGTRVGRDTVIYPFTVIEKDVRIGRNCVIGPFVHLREGTRVADGVLLGNFVEAVRARISSKVFAKHFCYLGDSRIGAGANIGAGTVTANFDGKKKNTTVIREGSFIGSDTVLIAPVKIGKGAVVGAGSVVTRNTNVPAGGLVAGVPAKLLKNKPYRK